MPGPRRSIVLRRKNKTPVCEPALAGRLRIMENQSLTATMPSGFLIGRLPQDRVGVVGELVIGRGHSV